MNRRDFGRITSLAAATACVAPQILAEPLSSIPYPEPAGDWDKSTPEQRLAIKRMEENMPSSEIFRSAANLIPQAIPDGINKHGWQYGDHKIWGLIDRYSPDWYRDGKIGAKADLSKIEYNAFYKQTVLRKMDKHPTFFVVSVPYSFIGMVFPGQEVSMAFRPTIKLGTPRKDIEDMAKESFLALQKIVKEYYQEETCDMMEDFMNGMKYVGI